MSALLRAGDVPQDRHQQLAVCFLDGRLAEHIRLSERADRNVDHGVRFAAHVRQVLELVIAHAATLTRPRRQ